MHRGIFLFVSVFILNSGQGYGWISWWRSIGRHTCPYEDPVTHECFEMLKENRTCSFMRVTCCTDPGDSNSTDHHGHCRPCYSYERTTCTMYTCSPRGCCEGWLEDENGGCTNLDLDNLQCENGGEFQPESKKCTCPDHFTGRLCETPVCQEPCENGGKCQLDYRRHARCVCPSSAFVGARCDAVTCQPACQNGGECVIDGVEAVCRCPQGFAGQACQFRVNNRLCPQALASVNSVAVTLCDEQTEGHCMTSSDCQNGRICCWDGCSGACTMPTNQTCYHEGRHLATGEVTRPNSCTSCVCQAWGEVTCDSVQCSDRECTDGHTEVMIEGQCCGRCPEDSAMNDSDFAAPIITGCPATFVVADVDPTGSYARLPDLHLTARDFNNDTLQVFLSQTVFHHSRKTSVSFNTHVVWATSGDDRLGRWAECHFSVIVRDAVPPIFTSCPAEIYSLDTDIVQWTSPVAMDNVGIFKIKANGDKVNNTLLAPGTYPVTYTVWDYDQNEAICAFLIRVFPKDGEYSLRDWTQRGGRVPEVAILASICLIALVFAGVLGIVCRTVVRRRTLSRQNTAASASSAIDDDNHIYAVCGPQQSPYKNLNMLKLPAYTPPANPPPYDDVIPDQESPYVNSSVMDVPYENVNSVTDRKVHYANPCFALSE